MLIRHINLTNVYIYTNNTLTNILQNKNVTLCGEVILTH